MSYNQPWQLQRKVFYYLDFITVEPTLYLYMMAFMTTSVVEEAFFVDKACRVNHGYNQTVCDNINEKKYAEFLKPVQVTVSNFHYKYDIAGHAGQIILAFFMGAWSDKRGRKLPLLIGLLGKLYYSFMIVMNSIQPTWPVEYIIYNANLPMAFTGADVAIFAAAFTYLVDVSSSENRTIRVTLLEVIYLSTMPTGIALGSFLFTLTNRSYTIMFIINCSLLVLAILYSFIRLKWRTSDKQRPLPGALYIIGDFFDYKHVLGTFQTILKKRPSRRRVYLWLLIIMMGLYTFQRDEKRNSYLYLQLVFNWDVSQISNLRTFQYAMQDIGLITAIPLMSKVLGWRDTTIVMFGAFSHTIARVFFITANIDWVFYAGAGFAALGPIVAPVIRSMVSKIVPIAERGKAFSILSVADNAIPIFSGVMYSKIFNATLHDHPETFFYLTIATQSVLFLLIVYVHWTANTEANLVHEEEISGTIEEYHPGELDE